MPVRMDWDNEARTHLRRSIDGKWTWDEVWASVAETQAMLDKLGDDARVVLIYQLTSRAWRTIPSGIRGTRDRLVNLLYPKVSKVVIVAPPNNSTAQTVKHACAEYLTQLTNYYFVDSLEEARRIMPEQKS